MGHIDIVPEALEISTTTTVGSKIGIAHIQLSDSVLSKSIELVSSTESLSFAHGAFTTPQTYNVDIILNKTLPLGLTYDTISVLKERSPIICKNLVISMISCFDITPISINYGFMRVGETKKRTLRIGKMKPQDLKLSVHKIDMKNVSLDYSVSSGKDEIEVVVTLKSLKSGTILGFLRIENFQTTETTSLQYVDVPINATIY